MKLSLEMIDFQKEGFKALDIVVEQLYKKAQEITSRSAFLNDKEVGDLKKLLEHTLTERFGISYNLIFNTDYEGCMVVFPINKNNILLNSNERGYLNNSVYEKLRKDFNNKTGTVDNKNAKVSGIFSVYTHDFYLNIHSLVKHKLTVREIAAIILHEVGHSYTYYEFADRTDTTNRVLSELSDILKEGNPTKITYKFRELAKTMNEEEDYFDEVANSSNRTIMGVKFFKKYIQTVGKQASNLKYSETASEQLADNFAARFGYGRDLITGLDKFSLYTSDRNTAIYLINTLFSVLGVIETSIILIAVIFVSLPVGAVIGILVLIINYLNENMYLEGTKNADYTYDNLFSRYERIKHQVVAQLKDEVLSKEDTKLILKQLSTIDEIINKTRDYTPILTVISDFIFSPNRSAKEQVLLEKSLERLAHNELFTMSAHYSVV